MSTSLSKPELKSELLPRHVAIIMDGNGRWAEQQGENRLFGHRQGAKVVRDITTFSRELGLSYLTLYSFSIQNWRRPIEEVQGLMELLEEHCVKERGTLMENDIRLRTLGNVAGLPQSTQDALQNLEDETRNNRSMTLSLALNYGGREELVEAARRFGNDVQQGQRKPDELDASLLSSYLWTSEYPDPDLVIRTSGETRISNFLLWQMAYAELYFTDILWPNFSREDFVDGLKSFVRRSRRFGGLTDVTGPIIAGQQTC